MSNDSLGLGRLPDAIADPAAADPAAADHPARPAATHPAAPSDAPFGARLARVLGAYPDRWLVATPDDPMAPQLVAARGRVRDDPQAPPVTGDWVWLDAADALVAIVPREGAITRRAAGEPTRGQVVAAGVDLALITEPASAPNARRAERFAALAAAGGVDALLVLTKADLDPEADLAAARLAREARMLEGIAVSARTGDGLGPLSRLLTPGTTAVLLGPSGAGKSTLANALLGGERQATAAVRASDGRGRHTTVTRELLRLPTGALLIDTPGVREIGLWDGGTGDVFSEIAELAAGCRFADCTHDGEPGCAVAGTVEPERLAAWRKLEREQAWIDDRRAAARARSALVRGYAKQQRAARRGKGMSG